MKAKSTAQVSSESPANGAGSRTGCENDRVECAIEGLSNAASVAAAPAARLTAEDMSPDTILRELEHLASVIRRTVRPLDGTNRTMQVLVRLAMHEEAMADGFAKRRLSQADLASSIGIRPQSVGPVLVQLVDEGLIVREPSDDDRRTILLSLTDLGRDRAEDGRRMQREFAEETFSALTDEERVQFANAILKLNDDLRQRKLCP